MTRWVVAALILQVGLAITDYLAPDEVIFTSMFVLAPFALAVSGNTRATAALGVIAVVLSGLSGTWNDYAGSTDHLLRITIVAAGSILATFAARAIERSHKERARMALLAAIGNLSGAERIEDAIKGIADTLVPAVAATCWIDIDEPDGEQRRLFEHGPDAPQPGTEQRGPDIALTRLKGVGVLGLKTANGQFDDDTRAFLRVLAGRIALVLANARLLTDLRSTRTRLDGMLGALAEAVTVNDDRGQTIYANQAAARLLGAATPEELTQARPGELAARFTMTREDGTALTVGDLPGRRLLKGEAAPELLTRSIDKRTGHGFWLLTKATLLHDQGRDYAVNIIENVTQAKDAELRQRFLAEAGQLLASSLDYTDTLQRVADLAVAFLADWCAVDLPTADGGIEQVALAHKDPAKVRMAEDLRRRYPPDPTTETGVPGILRGGPPELYGEIPDELLERSISDPEQLQAMREIGMRSVMIVPMRLGETTLGALTLVNADSGRRFTDTDFAFAQDLAIRAATAIQNARLYAEQVRVAHTLQSSLLPERLPEVPGYLAAASYQAGEQGAEVGGDFYDIVPTSDGRHLVFLGDVTGKGIAAAALTSLVRHSVRTAARFDPRPEAILALVNEILVDLPRLSPVTLVTALLDQDTLTVAAAGHPPPLLKRQSTVQELEATGVLLGAVPGRTYQAHTYKIEPGDTVLLYTDGVTDASGITDRFGPERLAELLERAEDDPATILNDIEAALSAFERGSSIDDRAMLVLTSIHD